MAETKSTSKAKEAPAKPVEEKSAPAENTERGIPAPVQAEVVAQEAKIVGDENLKPVEVSVDAATGEVAAQVFGTPESPPKVLPVHEVVVQTDEVITDTSDPRAVQVPDAGRGDASLPIHSLAGPTPEQAFADSESDE